MALSAKVALLTSLGFIFGMCWLVSQVARPMVEMPTPLIVRGPGAEREGSTVGVADVDSRLKPVVVADRFARSSPLEVEAKRNRREAQTLVVAEASAPDIGSPPSLPPLHVPAAPVLAGVDRAAAEETVLDVESGPGTGETLVPEAVVSDVRADEPPVVAVLPPEASPGEATMEAPAGVNADHVAGAVKKYTVKPRDTLVKIVRREWDSDDPKLLDVLLAANPKVAPRRDLIFVGEVLNIPDLASSQATPAVAQAESGGRRDRSASTGQDAVRWYTIRERDTLVRIARRMLNDAGRWPEIARLNQLRNANKILPGTRIKLPPLRVIAQRV